MIKEKLQNIKSSHQANLENQGSDNMQQGWEIKKLGEVCDFQGGSQPPKSQFIYESKEGYVRFLQIRDFASDKNITYIPESKKNRYCNEDDILLGRYGASVGKVLVNKAGAYNVAVMKTIPNETILFKRYLFFYLNSGDFQTRLLNTASRSAQDGFSKDDIFDFPILIPPLSEQQRIVSILDEAFAAIDKAKANAEQNLKNAKELFESYLQGVFENGNWETKTLKEVAKVFGRGKSKHRPRNWEGLFGGDYPFIQTGEVRNANKFITEYTQTYNEVGLAQSKLWKKGTICITIAANIAETAILDFDACIPDSIIGFEVDEKKADLNFAYYLLQYFKAELQKLGKGSAQDNINLGTFENQYFPFPSLKEQQTIVRQLDALRAETQKLEAIYQKKIDNLEELKKSILQKAFSGELSSSVSASASVGKVIPLRKVNGISATDLQAGITAFALKKHIDKNQQHSFHHVKAEKIVHLSEYILNIDLERNPVKDAAGPNDFPRAKKVESRARKAGFYYVFKNGESYDYQIGRNINSVIQNTLNSLGEKADTLSQIIDLLIPINTQQAEIVATVYAAWNNLLLRGVPFSDEDIVTEARENWHPAKKNFSKDRFFNAIEWIRKNELLIPKGNGKLISKK